MSGAGAGEGAVPGLQQHKVFKIIVLGDSGVGKTCLTYRFCEGGFLQRAEATIGVDFRERVVRINNEDIRMSDSQQLRDLFEDVLGSSESKEQRSDVREGQKRNKLQLWDTAGQERFRKSMVQHYYRNVHAVVIVYDVTKPHSFQSISSWMQEVESHGLSGAPRVLVGNKCDCGSADSRVATPLATRLADKHGMPLFETSARLDSECDNVEAIFMTLAHKLYTKQPLRVTSLEEECKSGGNNAVKLSRQRNNHRVQPSTTAPNDNSCC